MVLGNFESDYEVWGWPRVIIVNCHREHALFVSVFLSGFSVSPFRSLNVSFKQVSPKVMARSFFCASFAYLTARASKTIQFQQRLFSLHLPRIPGGQIRGHVEIGGYQLLGNWTLSPLFNIMRRHLLLRITSFYLQFSQSGGFQISIAMHQK